MVVGGLKVWSGDEPKGWEGEDLRVVQGKGDLRTLSHFILLVVSTDPC